MTQILATKYIRGYNYDAINDKEQETPRLLFEYPEMNITGICCRGKCLLGFGVMIGNVYKTVQHIINVHRRQRQSAGQCAGQRSGTTVFGCWWCGE